MFGPGKMIRSMAKKTTKKSAEVADKTASEFTPEEQQVIDGLSNAISKSIFPKKKKADVIPSVDELAEQIREAMRNQGTYSPDLEFAIVNAATNYRLLLITRKDVSKLSKTFYLTYTREGHKDYKEHPLVKTIDRVQSSCSASLKVIGLTLEQLHVAEDDPFLKLMEGVASITKA